MYEQYMFRANRSMDGKEVIGFLVDVLGDQCILKPHNVSKCERCDTDTLVRYKKRHSDNEICLN